MKRRIEWGGRRGVELVGEGESRGESLEEGRESRRRDRVSKKREPLRGVMRSHPETQRGFIQGDYSLVGTA